MGTVLSYLDMYKVLVLTAVMLQLLSQNLEVIATDADVLMDTFSMLNPWHSLRKLINDPPADEKLNNYKTKLTCLNFLKNFDRKRIFKVNKYLYSIMMKNCVGNLK